MKTNKNVNVDTNEVKCPNCEEMIQIEDLMDNEDYMEVDCQNCDYPIKINKEFDDNDEIVDFDIY